jgi:P-type Ca2+ transporter type 2C
VKNSAIVPLHTVVPGRARFGVVGLRRNDRLKRALEMGLAGRDVRWVRASTTTGNVLVLFDAEHDWTNIARRLCELVKRAADPAMTDRGITGRGSWHAITADRVIAAVGAGSSGLSRREAKRRLREHGANTIPRIHGRTQVEILLSQFHSMPIALLGVGAVLSIATGGILDAAIILGVIGLNGLIGFVTEARAEATIGSLTQSRAPVARVLRDGAERELPAEDLVPGDVIDLRRDETVPADARLVGADHLSVNEAMLTGESIPVVKASNLVAPPSTPIADRHNMVFHGTVVTGGTGRAVIVATGAESELGHIQSLVDSEDRPATALQRQLHGLGHQVVYASAAACALFTAIGLARGFRWLPLLKTVISLAVAAVPEGLTTLATTILGLAIQELRQRRIVVRRLDAVEALAAVDVVCFDKTGTLTINDMTVVSLCWDGRRARLVEDEFRTDNGTVVDCQTDPELVRLLELAVLCNDTELFDAADHSIKGSATEAALVQAAIRAGFDVRAIRARHPRRASIQRAEDRRYMATVHHMGADRNLIVVKGDPSEVLALCRSRLRNGITTRLQRAGRRVITAENDRMASDGLRVLGFAFRSAKVEEAATETEKDFVWVGLIGMADPIRRDAPDLINSLSRAGITSVMLTGDQRATAAAVAAELGLSSGNPAEIVEAQQIDEHMGVPAVASGLPRVFARVAPGQKLQLVKMLQRSGQVVAMVGDGVNDTPPLRAADIGIALGRSGVEAARRIADVVLLEDDLASLAGAVARGRAVAINIRKAIRYLLATNLSEIFVMLAAAAAGRAQPLSPIQLPWINLLTDVLPALGLATDAPPPELMTRPPPHTGEPVVSGADFGKLVRDASLMAASAFIAQACAGGSYGRKQTVRFASLVAAQLFYAFACRSAGGSGSSAAALPPNPVFSGTLAISFAAQVAALFLPGFRNLFGPRLGIAEFGISLASGTVPLIAIDILRKLRSPPA